MSNARILLHSKYRPARGGHAPGDVRDAFLEAAELLRNHQVGMPIPTVELREQEMPLSALCGLLWNCTDIMPGYACDEVGSFMEVNGWEYEKCLRRGATYAQAARAIRAVITRSASHKAA